MSLNDLFDMADAPAADLAPLDVLGGHAATLHVSGDAVDPDVVSRLFGLSPTESEQRGLPQVRADGSEERVSSSGRWSFGIARAGTSAMGVDEAVQTLLAHFPDDLATWRAVGELGALHISINLAIDAGNSEMWLPPEQLATLAERRIGLHVEIFQPDPDLARDTFY